MLLHSWCVRVLSENVIYKVHFASTNSIEQSYALYPTSLDSQPSPPPPLPMDFMYEFLMFQQGSHDTREKLEYYQNFIMRLLGEVKILQETLCVSCQQKCVATRSGNQLLASPKDSMRPLKPRHVEDSLPRMVATDELWPSPAPGSSLSSPPIIEKIASVFSSLVEPATGVTGRKKLSKESNDHMFYAERDVLADPRIDVTFVYAIPHINWVRCVSFSRDGRYLAVGTGDDDKNGSIVIYEVESGKKYCELREYATQYGSYTRFAPWNLCFSSDGRYLAVVDGAERIIIWDVQKKRIRSIFHGSYQIHNVLFSPDGRLVAFWTDEGVVVLNMRDNSTRMASEGGRFDFNPGGRLIATGNDGILLILDVRTGKAVKRWHGNGRYLYSVRLTSDGRGLLCMYNDMVEQWDVSEAEPVLIRKCDIQPNYLYRISISPDHRLLACSNQLFDVNSGKCQYTFKGHIYDDLSTVDFSAAGTYLAMGSEDGFVSLWRYAL